MADFGKVALSQVGELSKQVPTNLFTNKNILDGKQLNVTDLVDAPTYFTTDFIPVEMYEQYMLSHARNVAFYDSSYNPVHGYNLFTQKTNVVVSAYELEGIKYMRFSALKTALPNVYVYKIPLQIKSPLMKKYIAVLGDSLTGQGNWQPFIKRKLGAYVYSYGVGGTKTADTTGTDTTAMCRDERINVMIPYCDFCIFLGGTNDWGQNVPMGSVTDTATNTFYGALNTLAVKLTNRYPNIRIIFAAPPASLVPGKVGWTDTTGEKNNNGFTIRDYGLAIKNVAEKYGFPFVDLYANCWNNINIANFMQTEPNAFVHPNNGLGGERMAAEFIKRLNSLVID